MPMDKSKYPVNWDEISQQIRFERAGGKCEWCGVAHGAVGARDKHGEWHDDDRIHHMSATEGDLLFGEFPKMIRIVLTTAHLGVDKPDGSPGDKHDKMDCRPENLAALCQRCHLNFDRDEHTANRRRTLAERREAEIRATGQLSLWEMLK